MEAVTDEAGRVTFVEKRKHKPVEKVGRSANKLSNREFYQICQIFRNRASIDQLLKAGNVIDEVLEERNQEEAEDVSVH